jgi:hypothetical protein
MHCSSKRSLRPDKRFDSKQLREHNNAFVQISSHADKLRDYFAPRFFCAPDCQMKPLLHAHVNS